MHPQLRAAFSGLPNDRLSPRRSFRTYSGGTVPDLPRISYSLRSVFTCLRSTQASFFDWILLCCPRFVKAAERLPDGGVRSRNTPCVPPRPRRERRRGSGRCGRRSRRQCSRAARPPVRSSLPRCRPSAHAPARSPREQRAEFVDLLRDVLVRERRFRQLGVPREKPLLKVVDAEEPADRRGDLRGLAPSR